VTRIGVQQPSGWTYHLVDALGSVRQLVDGSAQVTLSRGYMPYGELLWSVGTDSSVYGYTGEDWNATGLVFLRARYMQPGLGMFLSLDPWKGTLLRPATLNGWNYVVANPIDYSDPSGLITQDEATRPGGADDIVKDLLKTYNVRIVKDWGLGLVSIMGPSDPFGGSSYWTCPTAWKEGKWRTLDELKWTKEGVIHLANGLGGQGKIQSAIGGQLKIVRLRMASSFAPGVFSWLMNGDIVIGEDITNAQNEIYGRGTVIHEFAHVWDYRTGNRLSQGLMEALGTWVCFDLPEGGGKDCGWDPYAKHFDLATKSYIYPERAPGASLACTDLHPDRTDPRCRSYALTYGQGGWSGPGWEDWAISFEAYVYPERLRDYYHQTLLVPGGVRERYVQNQVNAIP
jgi:RHS repeat-associated protein